MLDAKKPALPWRHGTGHRLVIAQKVSPPRAQTFSRRCLSPDNVQQAIASVNPYAVDACSALEDVPGRKNHKLLRALH